MKFLVFNVTDGVYASTHAMTEAEADEFIRTFPDRFRAQGFYFTKDHHRIDPSKIILDKMPASGDAVADDLFDDEDALLDNYTNEKDDIDYSSTPVIDDEDDLMERSREINDNLFVACKNEYPQTHFACIWMPSIVRLLLAPHHLRRPYILALKHAM